MSKTTEQGLLLASQLEKIGIITEKEASSLWMDIILWEMGIKSEVKSIYDSFVDYFVGLSRLTKEETVLEDDNLQELADLFKNILRQVYHEGLSGMRDLMFVEAIRKMQALLEAFIAGKNNQENPAKDINRVYRAGSLRAGVQPESEEVLDL